MSKAKLSDGQPTDKAKLSAHKPPEIEHLDDWISAREAEFPDIRAGLAKAIVWADPEAKSRTKLSIVSVHGFSASRGEVYPLAEIVARALGANLFYTRLAGHGRSGDAMAEATVDLWKQDMTEALAIGDRIGEKVLVIATSTGATLAIGALSYPEIASRVTAAAFLSANMRLRSRGAWLLTVPFAGYITRLLIGRRRGFSPLNALHAAYWTTDYPVKALLPMARLVKSVGDVEYESIDVPALFIHSAQDAVVDASAASAAARRWGGTVEIIDPGAVDDPYHHVVAGDALSPSTTIVLAEKIAKWFNKII